MAYNDCLNILRNGYKKVGKTFDEKTATQFLEEYKAEQRRLQLLGYKMEDAVRPAEMPKFPTDQSKNLDKEVRRAWEREIKRNQALQSLHGSSQCMHRCN